ncbi:hydrogenase maturation nickel metallochaperone HypA, partial [Escherichia sp. SP-MK]
MHELSLCQSAVEIIQRQAEQHDVKRVTAVWLEIGALSCVEESAVRFSFEIVCHGTVAQGCDLHIVYKPAQVFHTQLTSRPSPSISCPAASQP